MTALPDKSALGDIEAKAKANAETALARRAGMLSQGETLVHDIHNITFCIAGIMARIKANYDSLPTPDALASHLATELQEVLDAIEQRQTRDITETPSDAQNLKRYYGAQRAESMLTYESIAEAFGIGHSWRATRSRPTATAAQSPT